MALTKSERAYGQVDSTGTRLFFREWETGCLDVRVGYLKVVVRS